MTDTWCDCSPTSAFDHHLDQIQLYCHLCPSLHSRWVLVHGPQWDKNGSLCNVMRFGSRFCVSQKPCFRMGGTTHLLLLDIDLWIIMVQERWNSQSLLVICPITPSWPLLTNSGLVPSHRHTIHLHPHEIHYTHTDHITLTQSLALTFTQTFSSPNSVPPWK